MHQLVATLEGGREGGREEREGDVGREGRSEEGRE